MIYSDQLKQRVIEILKSRIGKHNAISANRLYCLATGDFIVPSKAPNQTRIIRAIVRDLRYSKTLPIISGRGYWLAETDEELEAFTVKLLKTAARQFGLAKVLSKVPVSRMVEQHKLNFTDQEQNYE